MIKLVATDLDGTLLRDDKTISETDFKILRLLAENNIARVAATGRSLHKVLEVLPENSPIDFVVFSTGGGIYDWNKKELLASEQFETNFTSNICSFLLKRNLNFFVFRPIPENNIFQFSKGTEKSLEVESYLSRHDGDYTLLDESKLPVQSGQFMVIIPNDETIFERLKTELYVEISGIKVIRTTSPVNAHFIWLEIFPESVSKGHGLKWLCEFLSIPFSQTVGIGNDFNDLDMFEFVAEPYLLGNSPTSLKKKYPSVSETNNESGFSKVLRLLDI